MAPIKYLVDTNILSELAKKNPDSGVLLWASAVRICCLSVITVEELQYGLSWRPNARIQSLLDGFIEEYAEVLPVTEPIARKAGAMRGDFQRKGEVHTQADLLIASTASEHGLTLVTRNTRDFNGCGVSVLNPFSGK